MKNKEKIGAKEAIKQLQVALDAPAKDHKVRITTMIDKDILEMLKGKAEADGIGYQTLLNNLLRSYFETSERISARIAFSKLTDIEKEIKALKKQMSA